MVSIKAGTGQTVFRRLQSCTTSRARPRGGGCGSGPRRVRITGRSRIAAMIFSWYLGTVAAFIGIIMLIARSGLPGSELAVRVLGS